MSEWNERAAQVQGLRLEGATMTWSPFFCPGHWSVLVVPAPDFFAPSPELAHAMVTTEVLVYGDAHLIRASFQKGARDFLKEPWDADEMVARALRRGRSKVEWFQGDQLWKLEGTLLRGPGGTTTLTSQQSALLGFLVERQGLAVSTQALEHHLYPSGNRPSSRVLASVVSQLRRQIAAVQHRSGSPGIESVRGLGYRLP